MIKNSTVYPLRFWAVVLICLLAFQISSEASADWCKYEKNIDMTLDLSGTDQLAISAKAGDLKVTGVSGSDQAVIRGKVCASKESWMEAASVNTQTGKLAEINVDLAEATGWSFTGNSYNSMDLDIEVPQDLALKVKDSSGDMLLKNTGDVSVKDSSGDIEIEGARGSVSIQDSSGDIDIDEAAGDLTIVSDSSGDVDANDIGGNVLVEKDSSGDLRFTDIGHDVVVERDSSGDITVTSVGGDFRVLKDGSGSIRSNNVTGEVHLPDDD